MTAELAKIDQALLRLAFLKFVTAAVKEADTGARADVAEMMKKGDTLAVRSPINNAKMARVTMTDPKAVATVVDPAALDQWVRETYPEHVKTETTIVASDAEVIAVLSATAAGRELLATKTTVPGWVVNNILTMSKGAGEPAGLGGELGEAAPPGIKVSVPDGVLSVTVDKTNGLAAFTELWDAGVFGLNGTVIKLPEVTS